MKRVLAVGVCFAHALRSGPALRAPRRAARLDARGSAAVEAPAAAADELDCGHFDECSGCVVQSAFDDVAIVRRARALLEPELGRPLEVFLAAKTGWRAQARLAAAPSGSAAVAKKGKSRRGGRNWRAGGVALGLYAAGSHTVVPIPACRAHDDAVNAAARAVVEACADSGATAATEDDEGHLQYAQLAVERLTGKVALTVVWNARGPKEAAPELPRFVKALDKAKFHSVWANYRGAKKGNAIFDFDPRAWALLWGQERVVEPLFEDGAAADAAGLDGGLKLRYTPLVFRQANPLGFGRLVERLGAWVPEGADVVELYGGVGAIGLAVRPRCGRLRCSEFNEHAGACFDAALRDQNKRRPKLAPASFRALSAADAIEIDAAGATCLIVDPPRKGLCAPVLDALLEKRSTPALSRLVYVSCGFDALKRDAAALLGSGRWKLRHAECHVLFPGSDHVETLAIFDAP